MKLPILVTYIFHFVFPAVLAYLKFSVKQKSGNTKEISERNYYRLVVLMVANRKIHVEKKTRKSETDMECEREKKIKMESNGDGKKNICMVNKKAKGDGASDNKANTTMCEAQSLCDDVSLYS